MASPSSGLDAVAAPRLRFAPSPTGMFHIGSGRTALFNWLFARHNGGTFVLRVEDTDEARNEEQWYELIYSSMRWLGLDWDEGPHLQSANKPLHSAAAERLYANGNAYYCACTQDDVKARTKDNATPGYDKFCRDRGLGPGEGRALRFRVPEGQTQVVDLIRGEPLFDNANIEDFVIVRSTGVPMYLLANVVDDIDQRITHVVRGEEHLPNTPKQLMIWAALDGGATPTYAHLPLIVNEKRQKISKRRDKVALEMYRDEGYLAEAMRNYLALLGWAPKGDREVITLEEMIAEFRLEDVNKSSAFFDLVKLAHVNGEYIRSLDVDEFIARCEPFLDRAVGVDWPKEGFDATAFASIAPLVQERVSRLDEVAAMVDFLFRDDIDTSSFATMATEANVALLDSSIARFGALDVWNASALHSEMLALAEASGLKLGKAQAPVRVAVTGRKVGPPLFESLELLGKERTLARLGAFRDELSGALSSPPAEPSSTA